MKLNKTHVIRYCRTGLILLLLLAPIARVWVPGVSDFVSHSGGIRHG